MAFSKFKYKPSSYPNFAERTDFFPFARFILLLLALIFPASAGSAAVSQKVAVPSYFPPGTVWTQLIAGAPTVGLTVINPANGPGSAFAPSYLSTVQFAQSQGIQVIGYVFTNFGSRPLSVVQAEIARYFSWYSVDGIFFDEASVNCADLPYYTSLYNYVKSYGSNKMVVLNPGMNTQECFMSASDVIIIFEDIFSSYESWTPSNWVYNYPPNRFWHLIYDTSLLDMPIAVVWSGMRHAGWVYVTPDTLPNPWDTLPTSSYWQAEIRAVSRTLTGYMTSGGKLYDGSSSVQIIGLNWFGFDTPDHVVHGLWTRNWRDMIAQMKSLGFNAVRLPFCPDTLRNTSVTSINYALNPDLSGKNSLDILDMVMSELNNQGFYILLDHHRPDCNAISELWYTSSYSELDWLRDLVFIAQRYAHLPRFIGIDLKNEPHGAATWGSGNTATDWDQAAARAGQVVLAANPNLFVFVEGVQENPVCSSTIPHFWGGNLEPLACAPLSLPASKLVLAPHVYGPDVYAQSYFNSPTFPANMPAIWEQHFGQFSNNYTIVIGEFGGRYGHGGDPRDHTWQDAFVNWLNQKQICNFFYWSWNPNSSDTGGLLQDDWQTVWSDKLALLRRIRCAPLQETLPQTGFPPGKITHLHASSRPNTAINITLEIPLLKLQAPIWGVPKTGNSWDVSWLGNAVGWLEGSAFPTWSGNTVLTAHVWNADNTPGIFANIKLLKYGDRFYIHAYGHTYVYEVRENVRLWDMSRVDKVFKHEELDWVTLLTCEGYNPLSESYSFRRMVRAVLVEVRPER